MQSTLCVTEIPQVNLRLEIVYVDSGEDTVESFVAAGAEICEVENQPPVIMVF